MSIECNNTTPAASRFSNLTVPIAGSSIDLSALIAQPDPLDQVTNRAQVISLTDKLNSVLDQEDLSAYPTLKERYDQFPLTYTEIASYVIDNRVNTSDVLDAINNYGGGSNGSGGTGLPGNNVVVNSTFSGLDFHYETNLGKTISEGLCGAFGNTLAELLAIFTLLDSTLTKLNGLKLNDLDPKKLAISLSLTAQLKAIEESLRKTIDELVDKVKDAVKAAVKAIIDEITEMVGDAADRIVTYVTKIETEIKEFFSPENIKRIKDNVGAFIAEMVAAFQRPTLANIQLIMQKLCFLTETIMSILFEPAEEISEISKVIEKENKVLNTQVKIEQNKAEENGAVKVSPEVAEEVKLEGIKNINELAYDNNPNRYTVRVGIKNARGQTSSFKDEVRYRQPGELGYIDPTTGQLSVPENIDYITSSTITPDETKAINAMSETGIGPGRLISFSDKVVDKNQWKGIARPVLAKLLRISALTGEKYVLREGQVQGGTRRDRREAGKVRKQGSSHYHHKYSGFSVELNVTERNRDATIIAASRAGFTGIGVARSFLRLNLGNRDGVVASSSDPRWPAGDRFGLESSEETTYKTMMNTHRRDGYRKKLKPDEDFLFYQDKSTFKEEEQSDGTFSFVDNNTVVDQSSKSKFVPPAGITPFEPGSTFTKKGLSW